MDNAGCSPVFATTHWSLVLLAGAGTETQSASALEQLCLNYWYPLYAYVRRQGHPAEDACDLTQAFFAQLLARGSLGTVSRERGRFRSFLLAAMNHFLADDWDRSRRLKRGGAVPTISFEAMDAEARYRFEPIDRLDAASLFDRRWALTILERALKRLEAEFADRPRVYQALKDGLVGEHKNAAATALELGMSHDAVRATLSRMRRRCRDLVREEIAQTVASLTDVESEYQALLTALRGPQ